MNRTLLFIIAIALLACGCTRQQPSDPRLQRLTLSVDTGPQAAIDSLAAIDPVTLGEFDRHYYNFLTVKARDKAYIVHTSDSLILDVINHFGRSPKMAEALYYAGRVYSDLGDYPTALRYFQNALEQLPEDTPQTDLRNRVLSQTGRLLNNCGLHRQAIPYLKKSLELSINRGDTDLPYDYQLMGSAYLAVQNYDSAKICFVKAIEHVKNLSDADKAFMEGYLAISFYKQGMIDSALSIMRTVPERVFSNSKGFFSAYSANIYHQAGILDTSYIYAKKAILSTEPDYRISGYHIILSPTLRSYSHLDTIYNYFEKYREAIRETHNKINDRSTIDQNSKYNYAVHQRQNDRLHRQNHNLLLWIISSIVILTCLVYFYMKRLQTISRQKTQLQEALQTIKQLKTEQSQLPTDHNIQIDIINDHEKHFGENSFTSNSITVEELRKQIQDEILQLQLKESSNDLIGTESHQELLSRLHKGKIIKDDDPMWDIIMAEIHRFSPEFETKLRRLSCNRLKLQDYRLAALIRFGFSASQIAVLFAKAKSTIIKHRHVLCSKAFSDIIDTSELNDIISKL
ncbi:MAG: tetratricopeptide repeat protein [Paramuribaculum sp.]|nr:tetratricopeptide repeat protein [Paramuribaculum sp.]